MTHKNNEPSSLILGLEACMSETLGGKPQGGLSQAGDFRSSNKQKYQWPPCVTIP